jgi:hypothetical protein
MAWFKILSRYLPGKTEENHEKSRNSCSPIQVLNAESSEYETRATGAEQRRYD